jgi:radical SAM protein with 4Fe4S-binding SPASM domain
LLYGEAARRTVDNVFRAKGPTLSTALEIIERIATKNRKSEYCPAFFRQLSVAADGSLYPCFMFIGDPAFNMGNLLDDALPSERSVSVINRYFKEFGTEPRGTHRWYGPLFGGCIANDYLTAGTFAFRDESVRVAIIQQCLLGVARNRRRFHGPAAAQLDQNFVVDRLDASS